MVNDELFKATLDLFYVSLNEHNDPGMSDCQDEHCPTKALVEGLDRLEHKALVGLCLDLLGYQSLLNEMLQAHHEYLMQTGDPNVHS